MPPALYETDLYAWSQQQVELLRAEDFADVDWDNVSVFPSHCPYLPTQIMDDEFFPSSAAGE